MAHPVSIIILNYRNAVDTVECLESVLRLDYPNFQVIVVDNASPDDSVEHLKNWAQGLETAPASEHPELAALTQPALPKPIAVGTPTALENQQLTLIESSANKGFAAGNNLGIAHALKRHNAHYIWLLNNDTIVPPNALRALVDAHVQRSAHGQQVGILGSKLRFYDTPELLQGIGTRFFPKRARILQIGTLEPDTGQYDDGQTQVDSIIGASIFVSADFINHVGPMAEEYFLYNEEIDWSERARRAGYTRWLCTQKHCVPQARRLHRQLC